MIWKSGDRVQPAEALFFEANPDLETLTSELGRRSKAFLNCELAYGEDWAVLFGTEFEGDIILPRLSGTPLYRAYDNILLPVGIVCDLPYRAMQDYYHRLTEAHVLTGREFVLRPDLRAKAPKADIYVIEERQALNRLAVIEEPA